MANTMSVIGEDGRDLHRIDGTPSGVRFLDAGGLPEGAELSEADLVAMSFRLVAVIAISDYAKTLEVATDEILTTDGIYDLSDTERKKIYDGFMVEAITRLANKYVIAAKTQNSGNDINTEINSAIAKATNEITGRYGHEHVMSPGATNGVLTDLVTRLKA